MNQTGIFKEGGKWTKTNTFLSLALLGKYNLGECGHGILIYIVSEYNRCAFSYKPLKGLKMSYTELAEKCNRSTATIKKAVKILLDEQLITITNRGERKGRTKYCYIPNVEKLNKVVNDYLEDTDNE